MTAAESAIAASPQPCGCCYDHAHDHPASSHRDHQGHAHEHCHGHGCDHSHDHADVGELQTLRAQDAAPLPANAQKQQWRIVNMDCPMEEALIRKKLSGMPGVARLEFNLMDRVLTVWHTMPNAEAIKQALISIDMTPADIAAGARDKLPPPAAIPWRKLALAGALAFFSEIFDLMAEWGAKPFGIDQQALAIGGFGLFEILSLALALTAIGLAGLTTYRKGWIAISNFNLNINALMSVAVTGAVLIGQFPEAAMVMTLFNLSEAIEARAMDKARTAIGQLMALAPEKITIRAENGQWHETEIDNVRPGTLARVRPGEKIGLDGIVTEGRSSVNQAPITGESMPVEKRPGDTVYAGTINESGSLEYRVTTSASGTTLARIIHAVEEAQATRAPIQRFVDIFATYYTPAVFLLAIFTAILPPLFFGGNWLDSIYMSLVVLVIGCPCALVISTPVSIVSGMAAATKSGILVKGGVYLEQGRQLGAIALDKTGTITAGKPAVTDFIAMPGADADEARALAAALAGRSDHPVSRAIAQTGTASAKVRDFHAIAGEGIAGEIGGASYSLGNWKLCQRVGCADIAINEKLQDLARQGKTAVVLLRGQTPLAIMAVADSIRQGSIDAIKELKKLGLKVVMLTGDNKYAAAAIAMQAGVDDFEADLLPENKLAAIEKLEKNGVKTGMVGDGINDAPALAKANISFAMAREGTDTAIETADVAIMDDDLRKVPRFIRLSRATWLILTQNIALALGIKAVFFALAFTGNATMWMAVFADVGAALLVVANGLRAAHK